MNATLELIAGLSIVGLDVALAVNGVPEQARNFAQAAGNCGYMSTLKAAMPFVGYGVLGLSGLYSVAKGINEIRNGTGEETRDHNYR